MVSPPPGVSSGSRLPPIASVSPRAKGQAQADAGGVVGIAEPLERDEGLDQDDVRHGNQAHTVDPAGRLFLTDF